MGIKRIIEDEVGRYSRTRFRRIYEGGIYHITQRAPGTEILFNDDSDYIKFISLLKKVTREYRLNVFSFSLLTNHLHLLFQIREKNLSQAMKSLFELYAFYFNKKHQRKGHVFCGLFRDSVVESDQYLIAASIYIHLNAYRAGLCSRYWDYRWHSLRLYLEQPIRDSFVDSEYILKLLDLDQKMAHKKYVSFLEQSIEKESVVSLQPSLAHRIIRENIKSLRKFLGVPDQNTENSSKAYQIRQLLSSGYTRSEILQELGISRSTLYRLISYSDTK